MMHSGSSNVTFTCNRLLLFPFLPPVFLTFSKLDLFPVELELTVTVKKKQGNFVLSNELIMLIGHHKEFKC